MLKYYVLYPYKEGTHFDMDYYKNKHIAWAREALLPHGLVDTSIERGVDGGGHDQPNTYHCMAALIFNSREEMRAAFKNADPDVMKKLGDDVPNYTDVQPIMQIVEVV